MMQMRRTIDIFNNTELSAYFAIQLKLMKDELSQDEEWLNNEDESGLVEKLHRRYKLAPLDIRFDEASVQSRQKMIPAEQFPDIRFNVKPGKSYEKQVIRYYIPYSGTEDLLTCVPNPRIVWTCTVQLEDGHICFDIVDFYGDATRVKTEADRIINPMKQQLENVQNNVETYNQQLSDDIRQIVEEQKKSILKRLSVVEDLGLPVRANSTEKKNITVSQNATQHRRVTKPRSKRADKERSQQYEWDVFISHASEDKDDFVEALAERLRKEGLSVWYDDFTLTVGDSLRQSIDDGLQNSRFGVVVLSKSFFKKNWPQKELDGLVTRERNGQKVILPIWLNVDYDDISEFSVTLADKVAVLGAEGLGTVVAGLLRVLRP